MLLDQGRLYLLCRVCNAHGHSGVRGAGRSIFARLLELALLTKGRQSNDCTQALHEIERLSMVD